MLPARRSFRKSPAFRRRFTIALAAAEDRLADAHAEAAMEFLRETRRSLPFDRALDIYFRLVDAPRQLRRSATVRALAGMSRLAGPQGAGPDEPDGAAWRLLRRLRGRRADVLRTHIRRAAAVAQGRVRQAYLDGAGMVAGALKGVVPPAEAVQMYLDALDVPPVWAARIFHEAVAGMASSGG